MAVITIQKIRERGPVKWEKKSKRGKTYRILDAKGRELFKVIAEGAAVAQWMVENLNQMSFLQDEN